MKNDQIKKIKKTVLLFHALAFVSLVFSLYSEFSLSFRESFLLFEIDNLPRYWKLGRDESRNVHYRYLAPDLVRDEFL